MFGSLFSKIVLFVLLIGLVLGGVSLEFLQTGPGDVVAKVGDEKISTKDFFSTYNSDVIKLRQMSDMPVSDETLKMIGYKDFVLNRMVQYLLIDHFVDDINFLIGRDSVVAFTKNYGGFSTNGTFDNEKFLHALKDNGINEKKYIKDTKKAITRSMITKALVSDFESNGEIVELVYKYKHQGRYVDVISLDNSIVKVPNYSEEDIEAYYEEHKNKFKTPEYRSVMYLKVVLDDMMSFVTPDEEAVEHAINQNKEYRKLVDRRDVVNFVLDSQEDALQVKKALELGRDLAIICGDYPDIDPSDVIFNDINLEDLPEQVGKAVLGLSEGGVSNVVHSKLGWHVAKVTQIKKVNGQRANALRKDLLVKTRRASMEGNFSNLVGEMNDRLARGSTIFDLADEYSLVIHELGYVDILGRDRNGHIVDTVPKFDDFLDIVFNADVQGDSEFYSDDGGKTYFSFLVENVEKPQLKTKDDARDLVIDAWKVDKMRVDLKELAWKIHDDLSNGVKVVYLESKYNGVHISKDELFFRPGFHSGEVKNYPLHLIDAVFHSDVDGVIGPFFAGEKIVVGVITGVKEAEVSSQDDTFLIDAIKDDMAHMDTQVLFEEITSYLKKKYDIKIYKSALGQ